MAHSARSTPIPSPSTARRRASASPCEPLGSRVSTAGALGNLCHTGHPAEGVSLLVASRAGAAGKNGNTVGTYICSDLACSLYIRGLRPLTLPHGETLSVEARVARLEQRLGAILGKALTS